MPLNRQDRSRTSPSMIDGAPSSKCSAIATPLSGCSTLGSRFACKSPPPGVSGAQPIPQLGTGLDDAPAVAVDLTGFVPYSNTHSGNGTGASGTSHDGTAAQSDRPSRASLGHHLSVIIARARVGDATMLGSSSTCDSQKRLAPRLACGRQWARWEPRGKRTRMRKAGWKDIATWKNANLPPGRAS